MTDKQLKRIKVVEKWLSIIENPFCAKGEVIPTDRTLKKYKELLENSSPPQELLIFKKLMKVIFESNDSYRITWLCFLLLQYYKANDMYILLPGHWEDELDLKEQLTNITVTNFS
uniref:Uncharacterized protein n=1 Tax=Pithovirus LCPAC101 TaxID=2506586 RepID=A0A481Z309_9VIRU|nr:MAG: hypothetical protein LCPAC101_01680 [Pithovirus LCPAC101]